MQMQKDSSMSMPRQRARGLSVARRSLFELCVCVWTGPPPALWSVYIIHMYIKPRSGLFIEGFLLELTYATAPLPELGQHVRNQNMFFWISVGLLYIEIPLNFFVEIDACHWLPWGIQLKRIQQTEISQVYSNQGDGSICLCSCAHGIRYKLYI